MKVALIGGGLIGAGWAARFALNGWDVAVAEPNPAAQQRLGEIVDQARRCLSELYDQSLPLEGAIAFTNLNDAVEGADWVQESGPERLEMKRKLYADIQCISPLAIIGSSTSGLKPSELQAGAPAPGNILVTHPFNPVYLLPLVEIVGSDQTAPGVVSKAMSIFTALGMKPLVVRHEIDGFIGNRLQEAIWREALWMIKDGLATTEEVDDVIRLGFGLRLAQMGHFEISRIAGGQGGMAHLLWQFGPYLKAPLSRLTDVPELDTELVDRITEQSDAQSGQMSVAELERLRDDNLVAIIRALKSTGSASGAVVAAHDRALAGLQK